MGAKKTFFWEDLPPEKLWYLVGLITSDGCLSPNRRHIDITAKDEKFLQMLCKEYSLRGSIYKKNGGFNINKKIIKSSAYRIMIGSKSFYDFLLDIGLTPKKSLTLGALKTPNAHFHHFLRGVIDGDGCIRNWIHPQNGVEQWIVKITSGSPRFLQWLSEKILGLYRLSGALLQTKGRNIFDLKFGKLAAQELLKICYQENCISLPRKQQKAMLCISTARGWSKSETINGGIARVEKWQPQGT